MKHAFILYAATLVVMTVLDLAWIGGVAKDFYKEKMGALLEINALPAVIFYLVYIVGIVIFVQLRATSWQYALTYGALFGFFAYATYDLTNLATIKGWPLSLALVDMAWGTVVTGVAAAGGWLIADYFES